VNEDLWFPEIVHRGGRVVAQDGPSHLRRYRSASVRPEAPVDLSAGFHEKLCLSVLVVEKSNIDLVASFGEEPCVSRGGRPCRPPKGQMSERTPNFVSSSFVEEMSLRASCLATVWRGGTVAAGAQIDGFTATTRVSTMVQGQYAAQVTRQSPAIRGVAGTPGGAPMASKQALIGALPTPSFLAGAK
jgi:hypothetical protein